MTDQKRKAEQFRALHIAGKPLVLFNIWDAGSAKAVATGGAKAIATGSWSVANANNFPDGERIPLALAIDNLRRIVGATDLPVTIDLESGYGDASEVVGETIALAIEAGAIGCSLEDSFPANGKLRETAEARWLGFRISPATPPFMASCGPRLRALRICARLRVTLPAPRSALTTMAW